MLILLLAMSVCVGAAIVTVAPTATVNDNIMWRRQENEEASSEETSSTEESSSQSSSVPKPSRTTSTTSSSTSTTTTNWWTSMGHDASSTVTWGSFYTWYLGDHISVSGSYYAQCGYRTCDYMWTKCVSNQLFAETAVRACEGNSLYRTCVPTYIVSTYGATVTTTGFACAYKSQAPTTIYVEKPPTTIRALSATQTPNPTSSASSISTPPPSTTPQTEPSGTRNKNGVIAGSVVGSLALISIIAGVVFILFRRKRDAKGYKQGSQNDPDNLPELQYVSREPSRSGQGVQRPEMGQVPVFIGQAR